MRIVYHSLDSSGNVVMTPPSNVEMMRVSDSYYWSGSLQKFNSNVVVSIPMVSDDMEGWYYDWFGYDVSTAYKITIIDGLTGVQTVVQGNGVYLQAMFPDADAQPTWSDIEDFVTSIMSREGVNLATKDLLRWGNEGFETLGRRAGIYSPITYDCHNLSVVNGVVKLPTNCLSVEKVFYNGWPLYPTTKEYLDQNAPLWRSWTGIPIYWFRDGIHVRFDAAITDLTTITMEVMTYLPPFTVSETPATTPLRFIPDEFQLSTAYYILAHLPAIDQIGLMRKKEYAGMWEEDLAACTNTVRGIGSDDYSY